MQLDCSLWSLVIFFKYNIGNTSVSIFSYLLTLQLNITIKQKFSALGSLHGEKHLLLAHSPLCIGFDFQHIISFHFQHIISFLDYGQLIIAPLISPTLFFFPFEFLINQLFPNYQEISKRYPYFHIYYILLLKSG